MRCNRPVIKIIDNIKRRNTAASILSTDFSALHTTILHNKSFKLLCELTEFCFKAKGEILLLQINMVLNGK